MLKLLKHDIKETYFEIAILNGIVLLLAFLTMLSSKMQENSIMYIFMSAWYLVIIATFVMILNSIIKSFYKKFYTDYGYLTLTTPVSIDKLILSKIIVNLLWILATCTVVILSLLITISAFSDFILGAFIEVIKENPIEFFKLAFYGLNFALRLIMTLIFILVLANSGSKRKGKKLKCILYYIIISLIISVTNPFDSSSVTVFGGIVSYDYVINKTADFILSNVISLAWSVGFYFLSRLFITTKLEIE